MKKIFLFLFIIFSSFLTFSQSDNNYTVDYSDLKVVSVSFDWLQVDKNVGDDYESNYNIYNVYQPSFIVTKTVENTKNGYLYKIWAASNTVQNGIYKNIEINDISISYESKKNRGNWNDVFDINFTVIGEKSTLVTYFYSNDPDLHIIFKWGDIKIN